MTGTGAIEVKFHNRKIIATKCIYLVEKCFIERYSIDERNIKDLNSIICEFQKETQPKPNYGNLVVFSPRYEVIKINEKSQDEEKYRFGKCDNDDIDQVIPARWSCHSAKLIIDNRSIFKKKSLIRLKKKRSKNWQQVKAPCG